MPRRPRESTAAISWFKVRVTPDEMDLLRRMARARGISASQMFRAWLSAAAAEVRLDAPSSPDPGTPRDSR